MPSVREFGAKLNRTDAWNVGYNVVFAVLVAALAPRPAWYLLLLPNLAILGLLWVMVSRAGTSAHRGWNALRAFYPVFCVWVAYAQTGAFNQMLQPEFHDPLLRQMDRTLFGGEPAVEFARAFPQPVLGEAMHAVYFSYYLLFPGLGLLLYLRKPAALDDYFATLCAAFYVCCACFMLFPAAGPVDLIPSTPAGGLFPRIMALIYRWFELPGGAFPSSHVVVSIVTLAYAVKHAGRWTPLFVLGCLGVLPATVYCSYHYAVDVIAGVVVGVAALALIRPRRCEGSAAGTDQRGASAPVLER